jgi:hypothetical protein
VGIVGVSASAYAAYLERRRKRWSPSHSSEALP